MKRKNLNPKEKFRFRMQRFLSRRPVVIAASVLHGLLWFILMNFGIQFLYGATECVRTRRFLFSAPNPFCLTARLWWIYLIGGAVIAAFSVKFGFHMIYSYEPLADSDAKGGQRWTTIRELKEQYRSIPECCTPQQAQISSVEYEGDIDGKGGVPISRVGKRIFIDDGAVNNLIIGMTRSGKGETFVFPTIDIFSRPRLLADKASLILSDPKGELAATASDTLRRRGYDVYVFNLKPPMDGLSYNPLELIKQTYISYLEKKEAATGLPDGPEKAALIIKADAESGAAETYAKSLAYIINFDPNAKEKIWQEWSTSITTAAILAIVCDCCESARRCQQTGDEAGAQRWYNRITMYSVARFIVDYCKPDPDNPNAVPALDKIIMSKEWAAKYQYSPVNAADNRTKGNITAETMAKLNQLLLTPIAKLTAKNDLSFENIGFGEKPVALFLVTPDSDHSNDFILSMFITQLYQALCRRADEMPGNRCAREVRFELDEFGNIPPIPHMETMITVCLGRNIRFDLIIQSYAQLETLYGKAAAETIIGNCGNQYFLKSGDTDTAKKFSAMVGNHTIAVNSRYGSPLDMHKSMQESTDAKPLINENDLQKLVLGENVIVRFMHQVDLKGRPINQYPIFNYAKTRMKPRYQYLSHTFPAGKSFSDLNLITSCTHIDVNLATLAYTPGILFEDTTGNRAATQTEPTADEERQYEDHTNDPLLACLDGKARTYLVDIIKTTAAFTDAQTEELPAMTITQFETALQESLKNGRIRNSVYEELWSTANKAVILNNEKGADEP
ncbi:MAG: type IV secretory system conjugative DNA transfer family protein [Oscillospiraceae bacterium]|nr:type IV secretory system conjugative DNA transfer family protein [Oscillospiraceae bacterium]